MRHTEGSFRQLRRQRMSEIYPITLYDSSGQRLPLATFAGGPLLVVNVASFCGLTPQYRNLQALFQSYRQHGLNILACPCNQFGAQEPCDSATTARLAREFFGATFPLTEKLLVNGPHRHPLYHQLIGDGEDIEWNFAKFLLDRHGQVVHRYAPTVSPTANQLISDLQRLL